MKALRRFVCVAWSIIREIGDQNAYDRHLKHHRVQHSGEEWRRFTDNRAQIKYGRPKCC
jgi:hypothetical protein